MKRPGKPCPRKKDLRFWPHHRIDLEELERRFYPGSVIDLFGWSLLGSPLAFLGASFSRESQTSASADALDSSFSVPHSAFSLLPSDPTPLPSALLSLTISAPPAENTYASNLPTQPANDSATVWPGLSPRSPGELRDPFAELFGDDGDAARPKLAGHGSDADTAEKMRGGGDGPTPVFAYQSTESGGYAAVTPYANRGPAGYGGGGFADFYQGNAGSTAATGASTEPTPSKLSAAPAPTPVDSGGNSSGARGPTSQSPASHPTLHRGYGQIPLSFEPNIGQTDAQVQFVAHGRGYNIFLTPSEAVFVLQKPLNPPQARAVLRMSLVGANPNPVLTGQAPLPGVTHYFRGNDPTQWRTNVRNYSQVVYHNVYPGIDLVYYGNDQRQLEYDLVVNPGANPSQIQVAYQGAGTLTLDNYGHLTLPTPGGNVIQRAPFVYQMVNSSRRRVGGGHVIQGSNQIGFQLGAYDATKPLYIDPTLNYSSYLGGSRDDEGTAIAVDQAGNAYVTGWTLSNNFPLAGQPFQTRPAGAFVAKLDRTQTQLIYSTYLGGSGGEKALGIAIDSSGSAYVTGWTRSTDFPTTPGAFQPTNPLYSSAHAFVSKLSPDGSMLAYSTYLGGSDPGSDPFVGEQAPSIAVDASGSAYITGFTQSRNFPTTPNAFQPALGGLRNAFVTKLNPTGSGLVYSTFLGGSSWDEGNAIAVDNSGSAYVAGFAASSNFPTTSLAFQQRLSGHQNGFVTKLDPSGSALLYSTYLGGSDTANGDAVNSIAVDTSGSAFVAGYAHSTNFPTTPGAFQTTFQGSPPGQNAFVTKLRADGSAPVYSTYLAAAADYCFSGCSRANAIAVDSSGSAYVGGEGLVPTTPDAILQEGGGTFVTKLRGDGSALAYSTLFPGAQVLGIALDGPANIYVTGWTDSPVFPVTPGAFQPALGGSQNAFIAKIGTAPVRRLNDNGSTWLDARTGELAPNTGTVRVSQPLDFRRTRESFLDHSASLRAAPALVYSSDTVTVRPIVELTPRFDPSLGLPDPNSLTLQMVWNGIGQTPHTFDASGRSPGDTYLLAAQTDSSVTSLGTGVIPASLELRASFQRAQTTIDWTYSDAAAVVVTDSTASASLDNSPLGPGWSLAGLDRIVTVKGGALMVYGSGSAPHYFSGSPDAFCYGSADNEFGMLCDGPRRGYPTYTYFSKNLPQQSTFDSVLGLERTVVDPNGLTTTFSYTADSTGRQRLLSTIQMPDGGITTFNHDLSTNLLTSINEPGGRTVTLSHDPATRDLTGITSPDGSSRSFRYDSLHHLTNQQWGPSNTTYSYDALTGVGNAVDWGNDNGYSTRLSLTPANIEALITAQVQAAPATVVVTDANRNLNTYTLDALGRVNELDRPRIPPETWQRDNSGQVTVYTDARGNVTTNTYDYSGFSRSWNRPYTGDGDLIRIDYPDGKNQQFYYSRPYYHNLLWHQDQRGNSETFMYDGCGDLTATIDANQKTTTQSWYGQDQFCYNGSTHSPLDGLLSSVTDANGHTTTYQYDPSGNRRLIGMTEATGYNESRYSTYFYDAAGNATSMTTGQSIITTYAHAVTTTSSYDGMRRRTGVTEGNGARSSATLYDAVGNITQTMDAAGRTTNFIYNNRNLLIATDEAVGTPVARSTTYLYDGAGNLLARTDGIAGNPNYAHPVATSYGYDALNRRTLTIEGFGSAQPRSTAVLYDPAGNVTQITDANSHVTQFLYDALNRRTVTIDATPQHNRTTIGYDPVGNITSVQAPLSRYTTYAYDPVNRRTEVTEGINDATIKRTTTTLYDAVGNTTGMIYPRQFGTPPQNLRVTYVYDALNRQTAMFDMANQQSLTAYDATSNVVSSTDVLGRQVTFLYDALNQPVEKTEAAQLPAGDSLRRLTTTVYDAVGNVTGVYSPLIPGRNNLTQFRYDEINRRTLTTDPANQQTRTLYDATNNVTGSYDEVGRLTSFSYDALNQRSQQTEAANLFLTGTSSGGNTASTLNDTSQNWTGVQWAPDTLLITGGLGAGQVRTIIANTASQLTVSVPWTTIPDNTSSYAIGTPVRRVSTTLYDAVGNVTGVQTPAVDARGVRLTSYAYDNLNRRTEVTESAHLPTTTNERRVTATQYDALGNVTGVVDPDGNATGYLFDALNRQTVTISPNTVGNNRTTMLYDAADNVTQTTDRDSRVRKFLYDALDRRTNEVWQTSPSLTTFTYNYDAASQLIGASDPWSTYSSTPDVLGRMTTITTGGTALAPRPTVGLSQGFDAQDERTRVSATINANPDFGTTYAYDAIGRVTGMTQTGSGVSYKQVVLDWTPDSQLRTVTRSTQTQLVATSDYNHYDALARLTDLIHTGAAVTNYHWDFDAGDRITHVYSSGDLGNTIYTNDANDQITAANYSFQPNESFGYTRNGNRNTSGSTPGTDNRLQSDATYNYTYDDQGNRQTRTNRTTGELVTYGWDYRNRLTDVSIQTSTTTTLVHYTYDAFDRRVAKTVNGTTTQYSYDGDAIDLVFSGATNQAALSHRYLQGPLVDQIFTDEAVTGPGPGVNTWPLPDNLGTIRDQLDNTGNVQRHFQYQVYGGFAAGTVVTTDVHGFAGREYDSETGLYHNGARYLDVYTGTFTSQDPIGFTADVNPYRYGNNNPTGERDPSGMEGEPAHPPTWWQRIGNFLRVEAELGLFIMSPQSSQWNPIVPEIHNAVLNDVKATGNFLMHRLEVAGEGAHRLGLGGAALALAGDDLRNLKNLGKAGIDLVSDLPGNTERAVQAFDKNPEKVGARVFVTSVELAPAAYDLASLVRTFAIRGAAEGALTFQPRVGTQFVDVFNAEGKFVDSIKMISGGAQVAAETTPSAYSVAFETKLTPAQFGLRRELHFQIGNEALQAERAANPVLAKLVPAPTRWGRPPGDWVWQHATIEQGSGRSGVLQLVPKEQHSPGSPFWRLFHPLPGGGGGYTQWAIPAGAPPN